MRRIATVVCSLLLVLFMSIGSALSDCGHGLPAPCAQCSAAGTGGGAATPEQPQKKKGRKATQKADVPATGTGFLNALELVLSKTVGLDLGRLF
jgi:hypothetical protein